MRATVRVPHAAILGITLLLFGCGWGGIPPNPDGTLPIWQSPEIATGAWTILGGARYPGNPGFVTPIAGFYGGLTANGSFVEGYFNIASGDPGNPRNFASCFGPQAFGVGITTAFVRGSAENGNLSLSGTFSGNQLVIAAKLSSDRRSILTGSYTVTGPCATIANNISGNWNAPLTGKYTGAPSSSTGTPETIVATLVQGSSIDGFGGIPITGNLTISSAAGCSSTLQLSAASVTGSESDLYGATPAGPSTNGALHGVEDVLSNTITIYTWGYFDPKCGLVVNDPNYPGTLIRQ